MAERETFLIDDGVRRAKAAQLNGHQQIWAIVEDEATERRIDLSQVRTTKLVIDVAEKEGERWANIMDGMAHEPDLFPPILVIARDGGIAIADVRLSSEPIG